MSISLLDLHVLFKVITIQWSWGFTQSRNLRHELTTMTSNSQHTSKLASVYTVGVYTTKSEDFSRLLSNLHIQHVFDVRNLSQQRAPARMNPAALSALAKDCGAIYYDMGETLGDKPNYQLFA